MIYPGAQMIKHKRRFHEKEAKILLQTVERISSWTLDVQFRIERGHLITRWERRQHPPPPKKKQPELEKEGGQLEANKFQWLPKDRKRGIKTWRLCLKARPAKIRAATRADQKRCSFCRADQKRCSFCSFNKKLSVYNSMYIRALLHHQLSRKYQNSTDHCSVWSLGCTPVC